MLTFTNEFRSTKLYNYEHVYVWYNGALVASGKYRWQNRPWQSFDYSSALEQAIKSLGLDEIKMSEINKIIDSSYSFESATDKIAKFLEEQK